MQHARAHSTRTLQYCMCAPTASCSISRGITLHSNKQTSIRCPAQHHTTMSQPPHRHSCHTTRTLTREFALPWRIVAAHCSRPPCCAENFFGAEITVWGCSDPSGKHFTYDNQTGAIKGASNPDCLAAGLAGQAIQFKTCNESDPMQVLYSVCLFVCLVVCLFASLETLMFFVCAFLRLTIVNEIVLLFLRSPHTPCNDEHVLPSCYSKSKHSQG
jgi:hypothetical protein